MIISTFLKGATPYFYVGETEFEFDVPLWRAKYAADLTAALEAEGLGRELAALDTTFVSTDRYILDLRVRWSDGKSASIREELLIAKYTQLGTGWAIASIGGVAATQS